MTHLEVWGAPIDHSRSPDLHRAAYRALGRDWEFMRREVTADRFDSELAATSALGLAVTYPLKDRAFRAAGTRDRRAELTGAANTLHLPATGAAPRGFNTDVGGIVRALDEEGLASVQSLRILGAGATAMSALVAAGEIGIERVEIAARRPERAAPLVDLAERVGVRAEAVALAEAAGSVDLTIATLPGGSSIAPDVAERLGRGGVLFDVAYSPWPSALAEAWVGPTLHGLGMLLHQAVLQVRVFLSGDVDHALPNEDVVIDAMRDALG